jgi:transcriptional regulator with XRE-family HTH domain
MERILNIKALKEAAESQGYNQSAIAKALGISKAAVSKWFIGSSFPRPAELLKLGRIVKLSHKKLVVQHVAQSEPIVAFRKRGACQTTEKHIARAKDMGRFLAPLVKYLDFDKFVGPPSLKKPSTDYKYLQELVAKMRRDMGASESGVIEFEQIVNCFHDYQAVIIPTLWGEKSNHQNALHIHLPESQTTWIYLNLDSKIHDFKFWMVHEFGHVITIDLLASGDIEEAEDFADAFAGALLFPEPSAKKAYTDYKRARSANGRVITLLNYAKEYVISPNSIYKEIQKYTKAHELSFEDVDQSLLHIEISKFNKKYQTVSESLFDTTEPTADHFMRVVQEQFDTDFYKTLGIYLREHEAPPKSIASILGVSPSDARSYHGALVSS